MKDFLQSCYTNNLGSIEWDSGSNFSGNVGVGAIPKNSRKKKKEKSSTSQNNNFVDLMQNLHLDDRQESSTGVEGESNASANTRLRSLSHLTIEQKRQRKREQNKIASRKKNLKISMRKKNLPLELEDCIRRNGELHTLYNRTIKRKVFLIKLLELMCKYHS